MEAQAMMLVLLCGLATILFWHGFATKEWCTGQTAFTGMWLMSAVVLIAFPKSWPFLTWGGVGLILAAHTAYLVGSLLAFRKRAERLEKIKVSKPEQTAIRIVYWGTLLLAVIGVGGLLAATGAWQIIYGASAAAIRYVEFDPTTIPVVPRILSNFMLVPVALAPGMAAADGATRPRFRYYVLPFLCLIGQSVAFGGRGAVTFGGLLIFWGFASVYGGRVYRKLDQRTLAFISVLGLLVLGYSQAIFSGRQDFGDDSSFGDYIALPIPAGCEVLAENQDQPTFELGFNNLAPIRESLRSAGESNEKRVDNLVVRIPGTYNVFTFLYEQIQAFGYAGFLIVMLGIGLTMGTVESRRPTVTRLAIRALVYCYLGMSLFADLAFFYSGWSLAVVFAGLGIPFLAKLATPLKPRVTEVAR